MFSFITWFVGNPLLDSLLNNVNSLAVPLFTAVSVYSALLSLVNLNLKEY